MSSLLLIYVESVLNSDVKALGFSVTIFNKIDDVL